MIKFKFLICLKSNPTEIKADMYLIMCEGNESLTLSHLSSVFVTRIPMDLLSVTLVNDFKSSALDD